MTEDLTPLIKTSSQRISDNQEHRLSAALEASKIGVFEFEPISNTAYWDRRVGRLWGIPDDEEIVYETVISRIHPHDVAKHNRATEKALDPEGSGIMDLEYRVLPRNGDPMRWIRAVATCSFDGKSPVRLLGTVSDVTEKRELEERNKLLINELQHRVKNTLATVLSVIKLSKTRDLDINEYIASLEDRLLSMSNTHNVLSRNDWKSVDIKSIVEKEFDAFVDSKEEVYVLDGPSLFIPPRFVQIISMAIHELVTNASKHGALTVPGRQVIMETSLHEHIARFKWIEKSNLDQHLHGQPNGGFGSFLLSRVVGAEVNGTVLYEMTSEGLFFTLEFPIKEAE